MSVFIALSEEGKRFEAAYLDRSGEVCDHCSLAGGKHERVCPVGIDFSALERIRLHRELPTLHLHPPRVTALAEAELWADALDDPWCPESLRLREVADAIPALESQLSRR